MNAQSDMAGEGHEEDMSKTPCDAIDSDPLKVNNRVITADWSDHAAKLGEIWGGKTIEGVDSLVSELRE